MQSVRAKPLRQPSLVIDVTRSATMRGLASLDHSFHEAGIMLRLSGDTIELTPPLVVSEDQIGEIVDKVGRTIKAVA